MASFASAVVLRVLGVFGFSPDPKAPQGAGVLEAIWAFYRRSESVVANAAPVLSAPPVTSSLVDGQVVLSGTLAARDPDFDRLSYAVTAGENVAGEVTVDPVTGAFHLTVADPAGPPVTVTVAVSDNTHSWFGAASTTEGTYRITVLKNARKVATLTTTGVTKHQLVELMIGSDAKILQQMYEEEQSTATQRTARRGDLAFSVQGLTQPGA